MSGGSMNYLYSRIESEANFLAYTAERRAFSKHLQLVVQALHDIEWVDSADYGPGDENEAIRACIGRAEMLQSAIEDAQQARDALAAEIVLAQEALK